MMIPSYQQEILLKTSVMPQVIWDGSLSNSSASSSTVSDTVKKSKASHVQAKKATEKKSHCWRFNSRISFRGFGALAMGGFKVERRVERYVPTLICSAWWISGESWRSLSLSEAILIRRRGAAGDGRMPAKAAKRKEKSDARSDSKEGRGEEEDGVIYEFPWWGKSKCGAGTTLVIDAVIGCWPRDMGKAANNKCMCIPVTLQVLYVQ